MKVETLPVIKGENNLPNYDEAYANFNWEEVNKNFTWNETGRVNMAYEAIDKHAKSDRKNKVALYYQDGSRKEKYTFKEMKDFSAFPRVIFRTSRCSEIGSNRWTAI